MTILIKRAQFKISIIEFEEVKKIKLRRGQNLQEQIFFYRQLAVILHSGMPLLSGLELLQKYLSKGQSLLCCRLYQGLQRGSSLAEAMEANSNDFPQLAVKLVTAGEESGDLAVILEQLAVYYEQQLTLKRFVQQSLIYPVLLLGVSVCVLLLFMFYILPVLAEVYMAMGLKSSGVLLFSLQIKQILDSFPLISMAVVGFLFVLCIRLGRGLLRWFLRSRLSGNFYGLILEVRCCKLLALLLNSGLGITRAVAIVTETLDDAVYCNQLRLLNNRLQRGITIEQAARGAASVFTPLMLELICLGASTGYLPQMLREAAAVGEQRLQHQQAQLKQLLVPLLMLTAALFIAGVICIVIAPLFDLITAMPENL